MSSLAERLRGIVKPAIELARPAPRMSDAADVLDGEWRDEFLVVDRKYAPGHRHGRIAIADAAPPNEGWPRLSLLGGGESRCLFLDLETTGLAGGAGTYAFLVGLGWFDGGSFRVRQFFLASYAAERMLLEAVCALAAGHATVVTYNGKSFDLPVLETRFVLNRMTTPFADMPHVDMLHHARRLWRQAEADSDPAVRNADSGVAAQRESGCRLIALEASLCGHEREGDVPGFEIPARYFHYVRTGDARQLAAVLEHNRLDLISLALLTARAAQLVEDGPASTRMAREAFGLGQIYERAALLTEARAAFTHAVGFAHADVITRAEGLRALATICRRQRDYADAAAAWRRILELRDGPPAIVREATEALAVHHEHRLRDPLAARSFAMRSLRLPATPARRDALQHRLARLNRKLGDTGPESAALF
jgi:uncharacterized protein YprB with RNaseH-like and TPR domain